MAQHGKKYLDAAKLVDHERAYPPAEAVELVKKTSYAGFDATIEAHLNLGVDYRHADQMVRGTVVLPAGTGKRIRAIVFAQGDKAQEALRASFEAQDLLANIATLLDAVNRAKPSGAKGQYLQGMTIAATMGPGIKVDIPSLLAVAAAA